MCVYCSCVAALIRQTRNLPDAQRQVYEKFNWDRYRELQNGREVVVKVEKDQAQKQKRKEKKV